MNGGKVRLDIDAAWKVKIDNIRSVTDGEDRLLYTVGARLTDDESAVEIVAEAPAPSMIRGPAPKSARGDRRITLTVNGDDNVTRSRLNLMNSHGV